MASELRRREAMELRDENRDADRDLKLGVTRKQPSRKRGSTFSVTFALTNVEDRLADLLAQKTGSGSRSIEARMALRERAQRLLDERDFADATAVNTVASMGRNSQ